MLDPTLASSHGLFEGLFPGPFGNFRAGPITGGCQCGAVRYAVHAPLEMVHYCHCRMCQRAVGNVFALTAGAPREKLEWVKGAPSIFKSSTMAERGFCSACGTPLTVSYHGSLFTFLTVGSLDRPVQAKPEAHYGIESQMPWLNIIDTLPRETTSDDPRLDAMDIFQYPIPLEPVHSR